MRFTRTARRLSLASLGICALTAVSASFAQEILKIEDQGSLRNFVLVEDEVLLRGDTQNEDRLKDDVEAALPGAKVLETRGGEALTKLDHRLNRQKAAGRMEAVQQSAPQYYSEPVLYPQDGVRTPHTRRYVGPRVLVKLKDGQDPEQLRAQSGAATVESGVLDGHAMLTFRDGWQSLDASESLKAKGMEARPLLRKLAERMWVPNDPYFLQQWHLKNRGQGGGLVGADANVVPAWDMAKGDNVTVVIVDDSLQTTHPDIAPSTEPVSANVHVDYRDNDSDPAPTASDDAHGTSVGGVTAAKGNNGVGGTGAAPNAKLLGVRLIGGFFDAATARNALLWQPAGHVSSVSNNSWGYGGSGMNPLDPIERQALQDAATTRRGGLGQVTLFAAANNDQLFNGFVGPVPTYTSQDANYQNYANSRFVIGVAACTNYGDHSYYSNRGASVLICAPSNGGSLGIFTTDNTGSSGYNSALDPSGQPTDKNYTNSFGGTSSATPLTSGVVALILSANPGLGYRDVMEILATTAKKIDAGNPDWVTNKGGFNFAHAYGAGMVDAAAAVARSLQWTNLPAAQSQSVTATNLPIAIPETPTAALTRTFNFGSSPALRVEHVEAVIRATHGNRSDLEITLTSPGGTRSILNPTRTRPNPTYTGDNDDNIGDAVNGGWIYMTTHNWGEQSNGTWTLSVHDKVSGSTGTLDSAQVRIYGTPSANDQRVRFTQKLITTTEDVPSVDLTVERLGATTGTVTVNYSVAGGTAVNGVDYNLANGSLTFNPGEKTKTITLNIINDLEPEAVESAFVLLSNPNGASLGGGSLCSILIGANDGNFVTITATDSEAAESPLGTGSFAITRLVVSDDPLDVPLQISGTATNGSDYETIPASVTIPPGADTVFVQVTPSDDLVGEGVETVTLTLGASPTLEYEIGEPNEATVSILDNERPLINLVVGAEQISESSAGTTLTVTRGDAAVSDLKVDLFIGGSAQPGIDYVELPDSVTIPSGAAEAVVNITPTNNSVFNPTRKVAVALAPSSNYNLGFFKERVVSITNDEPAPDIRKPGVTIVTPKAGQRINAPVATLTASGVARDNIEVQAVQYRVNGLDWLPANFVAGTGAWSAELATASRPGPNLLEVRSLDKDENYSAIVSRIYTIVQPRTLTVNLVGSGAVRPGTGTFEAGQTYTLAAKPATNFIFAGWTGDLQGSGKSLSFTMPNQDTAVTATFVPNPFGEIVTGRYAGLVAGPTSAVETSGLVDITVTKTGAFSGKLWHNGKALPLKGEFNGLGRYVGLVKRAKKVPLTVDLTLDLEPAGSHSVTGTVTVTGEGQVSNVTAIRGAYSKTSPLDAEYARAYTFYLPPKVPSDVQNDPSTIFKPHGHGVGTLTISSAGVVKWVGTLGDGSPATQTTVLTAAKTWPLYVALNKGMGYISGTVTHDPLQSGSDFSSSLNWVKKPIDTDRLFPSGFTIEGSSLIGVTYTPPQPGMRVLPGYDTSPSNASQVTLVDGNLSPAITKNLTLLETNKVLISGVGTERLSIVINAKTGVVSGSFVFPITKKLTQIKGVILQNKIGKGVAGFVGSLLGNVGLQTGRLEFRPQ